MAGDDAAGLARLQADFVAAVLHRAPDIAARLAATRVPADTALGIYRANARANYANALAAAFPALHALLGTDDWASLCWTCQRARPSRSGDLFAAGAELVAFLVSGVAGTPRALLADLAQLEWAVQRVLVAADAPGRFEPDALAAIPEMRHGELRFALHPAHALLRLATGTAGLWEACREVPAGPAPLRTVPEPARGSEELLVQRVDGGVRVVALGPGEQVFLATLAAESLAAAIAAATLAAPDFAAGPALVAAARRGLLAGCALPA